MRQMQPCNALTSQAEGEEGEGEEPEGEKGGGEEGAGEGAENEGGLAPGAKRGNPEKLWYKPCPPPQAWGWGRPGVAHPGGRSWGHAWQWYGANQRERGRNGETEGCPEPFEEVGPGVAHPGGRSWCHALQ